VTAFLLDTHIWFWYLVGSGRLPPDLRRELDRSVQACWLSPISVWELGMLSTRGRVRLHTNLRQWVAQAHGQFPVHEAPLNREVALTSHEMTLTSRDPADHFLAATALVYELTLMTVDERLTQATWLPTRST
jgi:PIN domain nuclease of toxin-antitoxin system